LKFEIYSAIVPATYTTHDLPGGPRLAHAHLPESECAALSIYIPVGSRDETGNIPSGLAHFSEHMAFKGTKTRSAKELTLAIESGGGQANACTSEDYTVYEAQGEAELMPVLINVLTDMVWHSTFPENEIVLERDVIGEEITMIRETPSDHINDLLAAATWPENPLGQSISGSLKSIAKIDHTCLLDFANKHHFRKDIVIATAGPMPAEAILKILLPLLPKEFKLPTPRAKQPLSPCREIIERRSTDQLQLALAWHTPGRHAPERHALRLLSLILGESSSSRLFTELREERGLCYQVGSELSLFEETGALQILAGLDPESREESLETLFKETADLAHNGPRAGELERAKRLAIAQSKLSFESTSAHCSWVGEGLLFFGHIPSPQQARENLLQVTDAEVQAIAQKIFAQKPAMAEIRAKGR
jgi:predicted Zn-dependent peptidase